jgi:hypothetical protein
MSIFRLVLCLAGIAAYLVAKQWLQPGTPPIGPAEPNTSAVPAADTPQVVPPHPTALEAPKAQQDLAQAGK